MSIEQRRTKRIFEVIQEIVGAEGKDFRPGDIASVLLKAETAIGQRLARAKRKLRDLHWQDARNNI